MWMVLMLLGVCLVLLVVELLRHLDGMHIRTWVVLLLCLGWPVALPLLLSIFIISRRQQDLAKDAPDEEAQEPVT